MIMLPADTQLERCACRPTLLCLTLSETSTPTVALLLFALWLPCVLALLEGEGVWGGPLLMHEQRPLYMHVCICLMLTYVCGS